MPFKSDAQRRWGHSEEGEKALGGPEKVNEWDQATKGKKLPEKAPKMADGGVVSYTPPVPAGQDQPDDFTKGINDGMNHDLNAVNGKLHDWKGQLEDYLMKNFNTPHPGFGSNLEGFSNLMKQNAGESQPPTDVQDDPNAPKMADGGVVPDDGSVDVSQLPQDAPTFDPKAGLPAAPPPPVVPATQPVQALGSPDDVTGYLNNQKQQLNRFGPDQQLAVQNAILQQQRSPGSLIGQGLAGLGDAISQGVGRTSNPGFLQALQGRQDKQAQMQIEGMKNAREANVQNVTQNQKLDAMDPNSQLSKSQRSQNGPILEAMGFPSEIVGKMSAAEMETSLGLLKDFRGKELETAVARYKAQIEANQLAEKTKQDQAENALKAQELKETASRDVAEQGLKGQEIGTGELEKASSIPLMSRVANFFGANPAQAKLESEALGNSAVPVGPYGATVDRGGKTYVWSPVTQKYHPQ